MGIARLVLISLLIGFCGATARAACSPGQTPGYSDIRSITIDRHGLAGARGQFSAKFLLDRVRNNDDELFAQLTSRQRLRGSFIEDDPQTFAKLRAVLEADHFYDLRLTRASIFRLDGPEDVVSVTRCGVVTTIGTVTPGYVFVDLTNGQWDALEKLMGDLQSTIFALPWTAVTPSPAPTATP